jgi:hypothetical protein
MFREFFGETDPFAGMGAGGGQRTFKVHFNSGGSGGSHQFSGFQDIFGAGFGSFPGAGQQGSGGFQQQAQRGRAGVHSRTLEVILDLLSTPWLAHLNHSIRRGPFAKRLPCNVNQERLCSRQRES